LIRKQNQTQKLNFMSRHKKNLLICLGLLISFMPATAQQEKTITKFYLQGALGGGSFNSLSSDVSLQTILKNKWSASLSYQTLEEMKPNNIPKDYIPGTGHGEFLFIPYSYTGTVDNVNMKLVSLTGGRYFKLGRNTWATTEAGLSYVKGQKTKFNSIPITSGSTNYLLGWEEYTTSNYETTLENKSTIGLMAKADINWAFASFMGIGCGVYGNLNSIQSPVGFHVKLMVGMMGRQKRSKR
jgi:hypothetical protein